MFFIAYDRDVTVESVSRDFSSLEAKIQISELTSSSKHKRRLTTHSILYNSIAFVKVVVANQSSSIARNQVEADAWEYEHLDEFMVPRTCELLSIHDATLVETRHEENLPYRTQYRIPSRRNHGSRPFTSLASVYSVGYN